MKKEYVNPAMEIVEIGLNTLICTSSIGLTSGSVDNGQALSPDFDEEDMDDFQSSIVKSAEGYV